MENAPNHSPRAASALAAVLALLATPALAQTALPADPAPLATPASPTIDAPAADASPTVTAPNSDVTPPVALAPEPIVAPVAAPVPDAIVSESSPPTVLATAAKPRSVAHLNPALRSASKPVVAQPTASDGAAASTPVAPVVVSLAPRPQAVIPQPAIASSPAPRDSGTNDEALLVGVALAGLAAVGATLLARRRREDEDRVGEFETPAATANQTPEPDLVEAAVSEAQPNTAAIGATFEMPVGPVPTGAGRRELIARMVAATPDEANPFHLAQARTRRARIILQHREQLLRDAATAPFDWRNYTPLAQSGEIDPLPTRPEKVAALV